SHPGPAEGDGQRAGRARLAALRRAVARSADGRGRLRDRGGVWEAVVMQRARSAVVTLVAFAAFAGPALSGSATATAAVPIPAHVYAPYFETWTSDAITTIAEQSGARYFTLAFLETLGKTSCTLAWNGSRSETVAAGRYLSDIASLRGLGGDVIPSFGGWSADQGGTEIGDSCKDRATIAAAYEQVVKSYDLHRHGRSGRERVQRSARAAAHVAARQDPCTALGDAGRDDHERARRLPPADRDHLSRRRATAAGSREQGRDEHPLDVGDPA